MMITVKAYYRTDFSIQVKGTSLKEILTRIFITDFNQWDPFKIEIPCMGQLFYAHKKYFISLINEEIVMADVLQLVGCDNLYRNKVAFDRPIPIDEGSLFRRVNQQMILVDDDFHIELPYDREKYVTA